MRAALTVPLSLLAVAVAAIAVPPPARADTVQGTKLTSDLPGDAHFLDPSLIDPIGITSSAGSPNWVADSGSGVSTLYNGLGNPVPLPAPLVVSIPAPGATLTPSGSPTGDVFDIQLATGAFPISGVATNGKSITASSIFLFATTQGTIAGWNPAVNPSGFDPSKAGTYAITGGSSPGAVYRGLAIATDASSTTRLYATNFKNGTIDVFGTDFKPLSLPPGSFVDPTLPAGFAPFNIQTLGGSLFVTYAQQDASQFNAVAGAGKGFIDVYNLDGTLQRRLVSQGPLDAPYGLALAPLSFGAHAGDLLVANHGDGRIYVFDPITGGLLDTFEDTLFRPISVDGLWSLRVGNGGNGGSPDEVFFTAGLNGGMDGLYGDFLAVAPGTPIGEIPGVPEPGSLPLFGAALLALALLRRRFS